MSTAVSLAGSESYLTATCWPWSIRLGPSSNGAAEGDHHVLALAVKLSGTCVCVRARACVCARMRVHTRAKMGSVNRPSLRLHDPTVDSTQTARSYLPGSTRACLAALARA